MVRFLVFSDLHYKEGMYAVKVQDLKQIMARAKERDVDFVLHAGDFSNDYKGSPEIVREYLENPYSLPAYGVYGNHELESEGNSMEVVTPLLTNDGQVVWGSPSGRIEDGKIGYYYFQKNGFRLICLDTNYSYNAEKQLWEHNRTASWGEPAGNLYAHSLGPEQLQWLERVLVDAADLGIPCILVSHGEFADDVRHSPDADAVQALIRKANGIQPGTVRLCINGHYHTNHLKIQENVLYFDVNTAINGFWMQKKEQHYLDAHTFALEHYDEQGNKTHGELVPLSALWQSVNTHYFEEPLSAIVTIHDDGSIQVEGSQTNWRYGVAPVNPWSGVMPRISDGYFSGIPQP